VAGISPEQPTQAWETTEKNHRYGKLLARTESYGQI